MTPRPELSPGSFCAIGDMKEYGYQVFPAAWGATQATSGASNWSARRRIPAAESPRPWTRITASLACAGAGPLRNTGCPA